VLHVPLEKLPQVKNPGDCIGKVQIADVLDNSALIPNGTPVFIPMGDHPCSVLAALMAFAGPHSTPQSDFTCKFEIGM
jgi:sugar (pentulose or hexulose) kinase